MNTIEVCLQLPREMDCRQERPNFGSPKDVDHRCGWPHPRMGGRGSVEEPVLMASGAAVEKRGARPAGVHTSLLSVAVVLAVGACGGSQRAGTMGESDDGSTGATGASGTATGSGDSSGGGGTGSTLVNACATFSHTAQQVAVPSDIIIAVDQSGSMGTEVEWVRDQLNSFSQQITGSNVDAHVVLIVEKPGGPVGEHPVCVPPPLAGPSCSDSPPTFTHISEHVDSRDALEKILETHPAYRHALRPDAKKHVIVISDDESKMKATDFDSKLRDLPGFSSYVFHGIVCTRDCGVAAAVGRQYMSLAQSTGGVLGDLCDQNFAPVWNEVSEQVIQGSRLDCSWQIPSPPDGKTIDPEQVGAIFSSGTQRQPLSRVDSEAACGQAADGWYFNDLREPTAVYACPQLCKTAREASSAAIEFDFGCLNNSETVILP